MKDNVHDKLHVYRMDTLFHTQQKTSQSNMMIKK